MDTKWIWLLIGAAFGYLLIPQLMIILGGVMGRVSPAA